MTSINMMIPILESSSRTSSKDSSTARRVQPKPHLMPMPMSQYDDDDTDNDNDTMAQPSINIGEQSMETTMALLPLQYIILILSYTLET